MHLNKDSETYKESHCFVYSIASALERFMQSEYKDSEVYLNNAIRSLNELQQMKNSEETSKKVNLMLEQIKSDQAQTELLKQLGQVYE